MKIIIIEDEKPAAEKLLIALKKIKPDIDTLATLRTVNDSVKWLKANPNPDLIFMDIELTDGSSLSIFDQVSIQSPVIFTTAYDEYWQAAFEHCSIDYLLKPIREEKLQLALSKYDKLKLFFADHFQQLSEYSEDNLGSSYKNRFLVKRGKDFVSLACSDIAFFYATHKLVCLVDNKGQKYILDNSLADIEKQLSPAMFYRVNRKYLININAITRMKSYPKSKLQIETIPPVSEEILVSQENVMAFKAWMGK